MAWDGQRHIVLPSEGGHCDFAPNTAEEDALLVFLRARFSGHVSGERILAGAGFGNLYDFLCDSGYATPNPVIEAEMMQTDRNAVISSHGLTNDDPLCAEALRLFVRIYGSEAGNLALKCLPRGGLYIGGGIAPKIRQALESGVFMQGFLDKGRMSHAIQHIPVRLSLNPEAPLLGAAHMAAFRLQQA
jgi:glucokinase